jgi:hypothetical protein
MNDQKSSYFIISLKWDQSNGCWKWKEDKESLAILWFQINSNWQKIYPVLFLKLFNTFFCLKTTKSAIFCTKLTSFLYTLVKISSNFGDKLLFWSFCLLGLTKSNLQYKWYNDKWWLLSRIELNNSMMNVV